MKPASPSSVFLERRSYRRRRLMDAVRLLPILGAMLMMLPLFWPAGPDAVGGPVSMSAAVTYVFVVWAVLICAAFALWRFIWVTQGVDAEAPEATEDEA